MRYQCRTIRQIHQQLAEDGYPVTINAIGTWAKQGIIPVAYAGKKGFITYDNTLSVLKNGTAMPSNEIHSAGIRRING